MTKVGINGLGRIGRATFKIILNTPELQLAAVNDIVPVDNLAYLLKYDTVYGRYDRQVETGDNALVVDGQAYPVFNEKDPSQIPWGDLDVDIVFECTGVFSKREDLMKHIEAGASHVILSAPSKEEDIGTIVYGVSRPDGQDGDRQQKIVSCASCTTNSISPVVEIIGRRIGIKKATMTTVHAYTSSQSLVDAPSKKIRRGRAAAANMVPTTTGAAIATTKALPQYEGKFDGAAIRVPVPVGSIADMVFLTERPTSVEEINDIFREEAQSERYREVVGVAEDELVSADIIMDSRASIIDMGMTQVVDGDLVKIMSWYDNEWGYTSQMVRKAVEMGKQLEQAATI